MRLPLSLFLILALSLVPGAGFAQSEWELELAENGVEVFVKTEENDDMSVRVVAQARALPQAVQAIIDDAPNYPEWVHRCAGAYVLPGGTPDSYSYFSRIDLPFPFQDKEVVAKIVQSTHPETGTITRTIVGTPDALPLNKGRDRLQTYDAVWTITPGGDGQVTISCTCKTAAGAGLPNWIRKEILTGGPAKTMANLVKLVEASK